MTENLMRAGCFVSIIVLGYLLRRFHFFKEDDFTLLSRIVLKITLPAAIVSNFAGKKLELSILALALIGVFCNLTYVIVGFLAFRRRGREAQAFGMLNLTGYNIGNFCMPFVQSFLGSTGVITASLLDVGNSVFSLGGTYSLASLVKDNKGFSWKQIGKNLIKAVALDTYVMMTVLCLLNVPLPQMAIDFAEVISGANVFLAMLMLGVGLRIPNDKKQVGQVVKVLLFRYALATVFSLLVFFCLPLSLSVRQAVVMVLFSPVAAASPAFTGELKGDVGLASAVNSASVLCSVVILVLLTSFML